MQYINSIFLKGILTQQVALRQFAFEKGHAVANETSIQTMVQRVSGLHGTRDLTQWENEFVGNISRFTEGGKNAARVAQLTYRQRETIKGLFDRFFSA